ncbi:hypothetical protein EVAR_62619_1 [Eumeta japonica]|uniref:Mariner Mos1 transposase n=1 Tax=Eumeta variegata TaxID=151549 RepID=A0A4C1ZE18_EUMVA|nr:hypothetical protein EVAR_62619_1 [Eumeta japonica]
MCVRDILLLTDKSVTYQQIQTSLSIGTSQVHKILHEYLAVRKLCIWWVPHNLTKTQKLRRANWYRDMMHVFAGGDLNAVYNIVSGSAVFSFNAPETLKSQRSLTLVFSVRPNAVAAAPAYRCLRFA